MRDTGTDEQVSRIVGERLKAARAERGLTARDLAEASSLSLNTISLIERGKISPTIATLHKLARALDISLALLVEERGSERVVYQRQGQRRQTSSAGVLLENLGSGLREQTIEALLATLETGADSGAEPIIHPGQELVFCLEGCVEYCVDDNAYALAAGDSLLFEAHLPHRWRNCTATRSRLLLVIAGAESHEVAGHQHYP